MRKCANQEILNESSCLAIEQRKKLRFNSGKRFNLTDKLLGCEACISEVYGKEVERANTDPNTGLYNRRYLEEKIREYSNKNELFGMIQFDIISFKQVNDRKGHDAGDKVLRMCAESLGGKRNTDVTAYLKDPKQPEDTVTRLGGDEFAILMDLKPRTENAHQTPEERLRAAGEYFVDTFGGQHIFINEFNKKENLPAGEQLGLRFGIALYESGDDLDALIAKSNPDKNPPIAQ